MDNTASNILDLPAPSRLSDLDRLSLAFIGERNRRIQAEMANAQAAQQRLRVELDGAQKEVEALGKALAERYKLAPEDQINEDGSIVRAKK
jgi:hypothetical protein